MAYLLFTTRFDILTFRMSYGPCDERLVKQSKQIYILALSHTCDAQ